MAGTRPPHGVFRNLCMGLGIVLVCAACGCRITATASRGGADERAPGPGRAPGRNISFEGSASASNAAPQEAWYYLERQTSFGPRNPGSAGHETAHSPLHKPEGF